MDIERLTADFNQRIADSFTRLTKSERRIASFLQRYQDEAAFLPAGEIAARLELSEATMVRFAHTLGYESYPALREALQDEIRHRISHASRLRSRLTDLRQAGDIFDRLVASEMDYLAEALQTLDRGALNQALDLLRAHQRVFVFGLGPSLSLVDQLEIRLTRAGRQVIAIRTSGQEMIEPMMLLNSDDLVIAIGFFNMTPTLDLLLEYANEKHTPVILLTDTLGPQVGARADVILAARRGPVSAFHSLTVPMTIINALLLALSSDEQQHVMEQLDLLDRLRERLKNASRRY